ncbi:hypothetical protein L3073_06030 [Ancylomarina sp. DW003]|nr:hypothetical protein [Ancylomarina sp. DW003]MDE5421759.1 hypothetical protein [Ancylomarina sp. DW003]
MTDKKQFTEEEKAELLVEFGTLLNDQSLRIIEAFKDSGKDINKMLKKAWKFRAAC